MSDKQQLLASEAFTRATSGQTLSNYPAIIQGFVDKGIPEDAIRPRENVFTYHAWRKLGRQVRRGEHGVRVLTYVPIQETDAAGERKIVGKRPWSATVFHVSQTEPIN